MMEKWTLPDNWAWMNLSKIYTELESGGRPRGGVRGIREGIPSIGGEHLSSDGGFDFTKIKYIPIEFAETLRRGWILEDDILIVKDGATTGKVSYVDETFPFSTAAVNEHVFRLRGKEEIVIQKYLFYFLFSPLGQAMINSTYHGAAIGGINQSFVNAVEVPLPHPEDSNKSLQVQKQIITQIDNHFSEIRSGQNLSLEIGTDLEKLRISILDEIYSGIDNYIPLSNLLIEGLRNGLSIPARAIGNTGINFARVGVVNSGLYNPDQTKLVDIQLEDNSPFWMVPGDIFVSRGNTIDLVGRTAVYEGNPEKCAFPDLLIRIRVDESRIDPYYFSYYFHSRTARQYIESVASGTSPSMKKISQTKLNPMPIPVISLNKQKQISSYIRNYFEEISVLFEETRIVNGKLAKLQDAVLKQAFQG